VESRVRLPSQQRGSRDEETSKKMEEAMSYPQKLWPFRAE